jgi:coenzyme F420 hydrogenase subunit beta
VDDTTNIASVSELGLCTGCGTCAAMCPSDAVELLVDPSTGVYVPSLNAQRCNDCGTCLNVCPGRSVDFERLNLEVFRQNPGDVLIGVYENCYIGHAADHSIRYNSTSGGMVTALLLFALEAGMVDGALVTRVRPDRPLQPWPFIARTKEEIVSAALSKYCPVPANVALKQILAGKDGERFAVVGLPCHLHGIRKAEMADERLRRAIPVHFGLFCQHVDTFFATAFMLDRYGVKSESVARLDYRGRGWPGTMVIARKDGTHKAVPLRQWLVWHALRLSVPKSCRLCCDETAELADISFGDAWLPELQHDHVGSSIIVSRNEVAEQLLRDAVLRGRVVIEKAASRDVVRSQIDALYRKKKEAGAYMRLFRRDVVQPDNRLTSDALDHAYAILQQFNTSVLFSRRWVWRILKYTPLGVVRLFLRAPSFSIAQLQMRRIMRQRHENHGA